MKKLKQKIFNRIFNVKTNVIVSIISASLLLQETKVKASEIGAELSGSAETIREEGLGMADIFLIIGLVIIALLFMVGKRQVATNVAIGIFAGYVIINKLEPILSVSKKIAK